MNYIHSLTISLINNGLHWIFVRRIFSHWESRFRPAYFTLIISTYFKLDIVGIREQKMISIYETSKVMVLLSLAWTFTTLSANAQSPLKTLTDTIDGMVYTDKVNYMNGKLDRKGYFTAHEYLYRQYPHANAKGRETVVTGFMDAVSCMDELETREDKISKICFDPKGTDSNTIRRQPYFKFEWLENTETCHSIQGYFLSDEKMIISKRGDGFANWSDDGQEIRINAPNSRAGYHSYIFNKDTNKGQFLRKESIPTNYENCMDMSEYESTR